MVAASQERPRTPGRFVVALVGGEAIVDLREVTGGGCKTHTRCCSVSAAEREPLNMLQSEQGFARSKSTLAEMGPPPRMGRNRPTLERSQSRWPRIGQVVCAHSAHEGLSSANSGRIRTKIDRIWPDIDKIPLKLARDRQTSPRNQPKSARNRPKHGRVGPSVD